MIYRFTQIIKMPDGSNLMPGDPIILDNPNATDEVAMCVKDAVAKGLLDEADVKVPKPIKQKTQ